MHLSLRNAARWEPRRPLLFASLTLAALLGALALPTASFAATIGTLPALVWADPDSGYWIELVVVAVITAVAGIVFNMRRKPDA